MKRLARSALEIPVRRLYYKSKHFILVHGILLLVKTWTTGTQRLSLGGTTPHKQQRAADENGESSCTRQLAHLRQKKRTKKKLENKRGSIVVRQYRRAGSPLEPMAPRDEKEERENENGGILNSTLLAKQESRNWKEQKSH